MQFNYRFICLNKFLITYGMTIEVGYMLRIEGCSLQLLYNHLLNQRVEMIQQKGISLKNICII